MLCNDHPTSSLTKPASAVISGDGAEHAVSHIGQAIMVTQLLSAHNWFDLTENSFQNVEPW